MKRCQPMRLLHCQPACPAPAMNGPTGVTLLLGLLVSEHEALAALLANLLAATS